ncbi:cryptochrome/photolyase family protein [Bordetella avium]|uniref:cryptochrome/photolyase family protein n=1 Tax=Bordetella avium TaxID=521 RepID=UPI000E0A8182|nr:cryptochrome/photolyase family protein [Bordetella avium]RIQ14219.1 cryptochrome/photolyase family protein [Bordetella avium]RIQ39914.1 cryptochrome/photolyase family protein [Bordetella avium]RIQ44713.1 cryptochrome/photolyase family protein [Bordetella avium]RIQ45068.1 cryptochrome/photolyase family protein [Bordetella avium]RIQ47695.1 cryptochrome/photolyase family protein [Bordetella avium]
MSHCRHLVLVLGDQLDIQAAALDGFDPEQDCVWMAEAAEESTHVWSSQPRIALFLAAMRHFAAVLQSHGWPLRYHRLDDDPEPISLAVSLRAALLALRPERLVMTAPGDWRVLQSLRAVATDLGLPLELREDRHFFSTVREFRAHARTRKSLRLEFFYRELRQRHGVLMDEGKPVGGRWNLDADNRQAFGAEGPGRLPAPPRFAPDALTREVLDLVARRFAQHPGSLEAFAWPVNREQALAALRQFIEERLPLFGPYEDALWPGEPWLYHSQLSAALNLKLLSAREVVQAAELAYRAGRVPLQSAEGFIRQILGWREYVRGLYWTQMPGYLERNALGADEALPAWYWTGQTQMACLREVLHQTLALGYAHHIQRLMVAGLFALLLGVRPQQLHAWYLAVYVDAVEWVELPNTLGMSQYADGGLMASKPYVATGKYIERMGGPCKGCRYDPAQRLGEQACPYTTLYWDFLMRHEKALASNSRMAMQVRNLQRLSDEEAAAIRERSQALRWAAQRQEL